MSGCGDRTKRWGLVLAAMLLSVGVARAQQPTEADTAETREVFVENVDLLQRVEENGEPVIKLTGNVQLRQDSTYLRSARAVRYVERDEILFVDDVLIVERGDSLRADTVLYNRVNKTGRAWGGVRLSDGEVRVWAPSGLYFTEAKRAEFEEGVTLVDSVTTLKSQTGTYWSEDKRAEFAGNVQLFGDDTYLEADSVTYFRETEVSNARGHVYIERFDDDEATARTDTTTRTLLFGETAYNDEPNSFSRIQGQALLIRLRPDSAEIDTLIIRSHRLDAFQQDSLQRLVAIDSVRIWRRDFAAVADSVVYDRLELAADTLEEARLFRDPMAWFERSQISGDTMRVKTRGNDLDSLFVRGSPFVAQMDTITGRIQQLRGRHLVGVFKPDSTRIFTIEPNAELIYHRHDDEQQPDGAMQARSDRIRFWFKGDDVQRIAMHTDAEGTRYPEHLLPEPFQLDGFRWTPERRPTKEELLREQRVVQRLERYARQATESGDEDTAFEMTSTSGSEKQ